MIHASLKWTQFVTRKENMKRLFEEMQTFHFERARKNADAPLVEGHRVLEQDDIDRFGWFYYVVHCSSIEQEDISKRYIEFSI